MKTMRYFKVTYDNRVSVIYRGTGDDAHTQLSYWHEYVHKWVNSAYDYKSLIKQDELFNIIEMNVSAVFAELL